MVGGNNNAECVKVVVRCRPLSSREVELGCRSIIEVDKANFSITVKKADCDDPPKMFTFDDVYDWSSEQSQIYNETAHPIIVSVLDGYNGTIFAYGQTGAGKTFTMEGNEDCPGLIPIAFKHIFDTITTESDSKSFLVRASYLEIYNEEIRDLLGKDPKLKLELKETADQGVYVKDLTAIVVKSADEIGHVMQLGHKNRSVGATLMNTESSRSHSIFTITIECAEKSMVDNESHIRAGKLNMVDLAGSERANKTGATGDRLKEGIKINLSLVALGNVITALVDSKTQHIPYRDSKLTRLLQDSLGGNTRTVMVANCSPADFNYDETLSTLRYANRAKNIKNKPKINEDPKDAMIREFQAEIDRLKAKLAEKEGQIQISEVGVSQDELRELELRAQTEKQALIEQMQSKSEDEKQLILLEKMKIEEERLRMEAELQGRRDELEREKQERRTLAAKLKAMMAHVMKGGAVLERGGEESNPRELETLEHEETTEQLRAREEEIRRHQMEKEQLRAEQERLRQQLEENEEMRLSMEGQFVSAQEEVETKTRKLKKLFNKYQTLKSEVRDIQTEFQQEREDYLATIRQLEHDLKLKNLIINSFVPPSHLENITRRATWDEAENDWKILHISYAGNNVRSQRPSSAFGAVRPTSEYARLQSSNGDQNPRFKHENVISLHLDMPDRTTQDLDAVQSSQQTLGVLYSASDSMPNVLLSYDLPPTRIGMHNGPLSAGRKQVTLQSTRSSAKWRTKSRTTTHHSSSSSADNILPSSSSSLGISISPEEQEPHFPAARGLVEAKKSLNLETCGKSHNMAW